MFTFLSRFRRQTAVLTALALVASVLVTVPVSAADDDPEANFEATFSACEGLDAAGFEDVPTGHSSAGSIDCIAYYGITRGTSATTYSPLMSVTREHMALFLTRLAARVGIDMTADPDDAGFTDIGELPDESQTAINQLADLDITTGKSATTYAPADSVTRGEMALFISRLMDLMDPMADGDTPYGYIPSDVVTNEDDHDIGSPFANDLKGSVVTVADAVEQLWELGVATGISATAYAPNASITRAAMADFMAAVLNHSNARPAGVTMQATSTEDFGTASSTLAISYRDENFAPMVDTSIKIFDTEDVGDFDEDGKCAAAADCEWTDSETLTNAAGNIFRAVSVALETGNAANDNTWYAWMGAENGDEFVMDQSGEASITVSAKPQSLGMRIMADISEEARGTGATGAGINVNLAKDSSVLLTVQLVDEASDSTTIANADAVAKAGIELSIAWSQVPGGTVHPAPAPVTTDENGQATFTITGPEDDDDTLQTRTDTITVTGNVDGDETTGTNGDESAAIEIIWTDAAAEVIKGEAETPDYVLVVDDEVSVRATVTYYDQYGNPAGGGQNVDITINNTDDNDDSGTTTKTDRTIDSRGTAGYRGSVSAEAGHSITVSFANGPTNDGTTTGTAVSVDSVEGIEVLRHAHKNDNTTTTAAVTIYADDDVFHFSADDSEALYSYDSDDVFITGGATGGQTVSMDKFEEMVEDGATVQVVSYSPDGPSVFTVTATS